MPEVFEKLQNLKNDTFNDERISALKKLVPEAFVDGKFNIETFKESIGDYLEEENIPKEHFGLNWPGKIQARRLSATPSNKTLAPCPKEGIDEENTGNLFIEGDNLEVLKLLQKSYAGKIKMIYIDPPYNTGNDFVYKDDYSSTVEEYLQESGQKDEENRTLVANPKSNGRYHTNWLNMIYPRLRLARNLLTEDGVIFVSIDDNEVHNLRHAMNEIFGEENFVANVARKSKLTSNNGTFFAPSHEYISVFAKNIEQLQGFNDPESQEDSDYLKLFKYEDSYSKYNIVGLYQPSLTLERSRNARYFITCPDGTKCIPPENKRWRVIEPSYKQMLSNDQIVFKETKTSPLQDENGNRSQWNVYTKIYLKDRLEAGLRPITFLDKYQNSEASKELIKLEIPFDFSKSKNLIKYILKISQMNKNSIILDFFAGSCTTAQAVMELNKEDGGNRKFICVQIPEETPENSEARKAGYETISKIGKERIRRAIKKIKGDGDPETSSGSKGKNNKASSKKAKQEKLEINTEESSEDKGEVSSSRDLGVSSLDLGFKVFRLTDTNFKQWKNFTGDNLEDLQKQLDDISETILKDETKNEDLVTEIILLEGFKLDSKIEEDPNFKKNKVLKVSDDFCEHCLFVCLDDRIFENTVSVLGDYENPILLCKDSAVNDQIKMQLFDVCQKVKVV